MKTAHLTLRLVAITATATLALAQDGPPPGGFGGRGPGGPGGGGPNNETIELVKDFDANGDGWLNREERDLARVEMTKRQAESAGRRGGRRGPGGREGGRNGGQPTTPPELPAFDATTASMHPESGLYDEGVLRTIFFEFESDDWAEEIEAFYRSDVEIPATMTVDGKTYQHVGIRGRGNTSFRNIKKSLNVSIDAVHDKQRLYGYKTLNLLNANQDPSMMREVLFSHISREHAIGPKANFVRVVINGKYYGLTANVQQYNKDYLKDNFDTSKGVRWKVPPDFSGGGGLMYHGQDLEPYKSAYEAKSGSIKKGDWKALVELCRVLEEASDEELAEVLPTMMDIELTLWFLALDNVLMDDDGYFSRASDYLLYRNEQGIFYMLPHDNNETLRNGRGGGPGGPGGPGGRRGFGGRGGERGGPGGGGPGTGGPGTGGPGDGGPGGGDVRLELGLTQDGPPPGRPEGGRPEGGRPERGGQEPGGRRGGRRGGGPGGQAQGPREPLTGIDDPARPVIRRLLANPEWRATYLGHVKFLAEHWLDWKNLGTLVDRYAGVIEGAVAADVQGPGLDAWRASLAGETNSLKSFAAERRKFLLEHASITSLED